MLEANFNCCEWKNEIEKTVKRFSVFGSKVSGRYCGEFEHIGDRVTVATETLCNKTVTATTHQLDIERGSTFQFMIPKRKLESKMKEIGEIEALCAMLRIAREIDTYVFEKIVESCPRKNVIYTETTAVTPTGDNIYDYLSDIYCLMNEAGVPALGRWVVIPAWIFFELEKDERFVRQHKEIRSSVLDGGLAGYAAGLSVYIFDRGPLVAKCGEKIIAGQGKVGTLASNVIRLGCFQSADSLLCRIAGSELFGAKITDPSSLTIMNVRR